MGVFTKKCGLNVNTFYMADFLELSYEQLLSVNGGCGSGYSGSCGGGYGGSISSRSGVCGGGSVSVSVSVSYVSSSNGSCGVASYRTLSTNGGKSSSSCTLINYEKTISNSSELELKSSNGFCGSGLAFSGTQSSPITADSNTYREQKNNDEIISFTKHFTDECNGVYVEQRDFSSLYGDEFGNNACAATSLLNELSEQYTLENGICLTNEKIMNSMMAAVESGAINKKDATVNNWEDAANAMAKSMGLNGTYSYTYNTSEASITIYAKDSDGNGAVNHFVNDIGNGKYYDSWNGKIGNSTELTLATEGLGNTRTLVYKTK